MLRIERSGATLLGRVGDLARLRDQFDCSHFLRLPGLLSRDLLAVFQRRLDDAPFRPRVMDGTAVEDRLASARLELAMQFALNDPRLFSWIEQLSGCDPIGCFTGRIYRRDGVSGGHYVGWHSDVVEHRLVALSINLGRHPYAGGVLQIRERATGEIIAEVANRTAGDGVIFPITEALQHRVTQVEGSVPRLVLVGWFRAQPDFRTLYSWRTNAEPE